MDKVELLTDIGKVIKAIDDEVDSYIASRKVQNPLKKKIITEIFLKRKKKTKRIANSMVKKYS